MEYTLSNSEVAALVQLKKNHLRFNIKPFLIFTFFFSLMILMPIATMLWHAHTLGGSWFAQHEYQIISIVFCITAIFIICYFFFLRKTIKLSKDIKHRKGIIEEYEVVRKQYFKHTDDYFIFLNDLDIPNVRVTALDFEKFTIGGTYRIRKAKYSKIVLDDFERNELNKDHVFENQGGRWRFGGRF